MSRSSSPRWASTWATTSASTTCGASSTAPASWATSSGSTWKAPTTRRGPSRIYRRLRGEYTNVGLVVQAYLHRTQSDVESLIADGMGHFRLCKGAYDEPATIAFRERPRVTQAMQELIRTCFSEEAPRQGRLRGHRLARRGRHQLRARLRLPARPGARRGRVPDAVRHPPRAAGRSGAGRATRCASTCPTERTGIRTSCGGWPSAPPTCCSSCARWWATDRPGAALPDATLLRELG